MIAIKDYLNINRIEVPHVNVEQIFISVVIGNQHMVVGDVYIPPGSDDTVYDKHCSSVDFITSSHHDCRLVICGDYNVPGAVWSNDDLGLNVSRILAE